MKKVFIVLLLVVMAPVAGMACDICGCGVGNGYIGILPEFRKHVFGIRYRYNAMRTHVGVNGSTSYLTTDERYQVAEAWGGWNIGSRVRLMASLPYSFNERRSQGATASKSGIGDASLTAYYQLLNSDRATTHDKRVVQSWWFGGGAKFATGAYNAADKANASTANLFQLGSGSTDFMLATMYDLRIQDNGLNVNLQYKVNTANKEQYRYGNKLTAALQAYHKFRVGSNVSLGVNAGAQFERGATDRDHAALVSISGGNLAMGTTGLEAAIGRIAIGANFQSPLRQDLAHGIVRAKDRVMVHLAIAL